MTAQLRYDDYEASRSEPNIVVDGSPNEATVLTLTHWPGIAQPDGLTADLSAEMAFLYLDSPPDHPAAAIVTNNHFDQDGLVAIHALVEPEVSLQHRDLLIDVAAAGDFGTYSDRRAARASMAISRHAEQDMTCTYDEFTHELYSSALPLLMPLVLETEKYRHLWGDEDAELDESEAAIASGVVTIEERPEIDLAIVTIPADEPARGGHRFGGMRFEGLHPMALNNATKCVRLLVVHGHRYSYTDRYETWVQYQSRPLLPRVDLSSVADALTASETRAVTWSADAPSSLTPRLTHDDDSSLSPDDVVALIEQNLKNLPPAWNPYATEGSST